MRATTLPRYYRRLYRDRVAVVKRTISVDPDIWASVEQLARSERVGVSTVINRLLRHELLIQRGLAAVDAWEQEHGALTEAEIAEADRILDALGVGAAPPRRTRKTAKTTPRKVAPSRRSR